jgi:hypothetical protein
MPTADPPYANLGSLLDDVMWQAAVSWAKEYAPGTEAGELPGNHVRVQQLAMNSYPGGWFEIQVTIKARKAWQNERYYWKVHRIGGAYYLH